MLQSLTNLIDFAGQNQKNLLKKYSATKMKESDKTKMKAIRKIKMCIKFKIQLPLLYEYVSIWNLDWFLCTGTMKEVDFSSVTLELNAKNLDMKRWSKKWTNVR